MLELFICSHQSIAVKVVGGISVPATAIGLNRLKNYLIGVDAGLYGSDVSVLHANS